MSSSHDRGISTESRHLVPLFGRLGCNAEVCHGSVKGPPTRAARGWRSSCEAVLLARRLLEVGVPFVQMRMFSWDFHDNNDTGCLNNFSSVDRAVSSLIQDLDERSLLKTTIVALLGEMGRTPWQQGTTKGSDHWPTQFVVVAGGGFKGGTVGGATDKHAAQITDKYYCVESFARTIYTQLGIDPDY